MGILNRTPDSFYDKGATFELDKLYRAGRAAGGRRGRHPRRRWGQGRTRPRGDRGRGARTRRAGRRPGWCTLRHTRLGRHLARLGGPRLLRRGRRDGQRHQRPGRPDYAAAAAEHDAAVVVTHIRLAPGWPTPSRTTTTWWPTWPASSATGPRRPRRGVPAERIVLDAGLDLGKTAEQSLTLLRASPTLAGLGYPLLLSASNKTFLGKVLDLELTERREASIGAAALGIAWGCRIVRVHDVKGTCRVRDALAAVGEADERSARWRRPTWSRVTTPSLVAQEVRTLLTERGGRPRPRPRGGGDRRWPGRRPQRRRRRRRLPHPALPGRPRVVVVRDAGRLLTADVPRLVEVVQDPLPTTVLVLVGGGGTVPAPLVKAVKAAGRSSTCDDQGGGAQGLAARPPARGAGHARAGGRRPPGGATSARTSAASRACSAR